MKAKRILASVLSVALLLQLSPLGVLALDESLPQTPQVSTVQENLDPAPTEEPALVEEPVPTAEPTPMAEPVPTAAPTPEPTAEPTVTPTAEPAPDAAETPAPEPSAEPTAAPDPTAEVQALIDALPDEVTEDNAEEVAQALTDIDDAKESLTDDELAGLDWTRYDAAANALLALWGEAPTDAVETLDAYQEPTKDGKGYYQITNESELRWFAEKVNSGNYNINARLTADIELNGENKVLDDKGDLIADPSNLKSWTPIGKSDRNQRFTGTFDGDNKTISGLYINASNTEGVGLFGGVGKGGTVKNVTLADSYVSGSDYVGGICGLNVDGTLQNCHNIGTVSGRSNVGGVCGKNQNSGTIQKCDNAGTVSGTESYIGGVCGVNIGNLNSRPTIQESYNTGTVSGGSKVGGVCGYNRGGTVEKSYNIGTVTGSYIGGVCGLNEENSSYSATVNGCYNTGTVTGSYTGGVCGQNVSTVQNCYYLAGTSENAVGYGTDGANCASKTELQFQNGDVAYQLQKDLGGTTQVWGQRIGTGETDKTPVLNSTSAYTVYKAAEDSLCKRYSNMPNQTFNKHEYDDEHDVCIRCGAWQEATLNGDYYEIHNQGQLRWFANQVNNQNRPNINARLMNDITMDGTEWTPIGTEQHPFTGTFDGNSKTITGLKCTDTSKEYVGLFGYANGATIQNVTVQGATFNGNEFIGGVCGYIVGGAITGCTTSGGTVSGSYYIGGIAGYANNATVQRCVNSGKVTGSDSSIGGIAGTAYQATVQDCGNTGAVIRTAATGNYGGIVGTATNAKAIQNCYNAYSDMAYPICATPDDANLSNCYYHVSSSSYGYIGTTAKTAEQFASGEVAYLLQKPLDDAAEAGTTAEQVWGQKIGTDDYPKLGGDKVYQSAPCPANYSNTAQQALDHNYTTGGVCSRCGEWQEAKQAADGYYEISNQGQLRWFANLINTTSNGETKINARLTEDITMDGTEWTPIGAVDHPFTGEFDGNGKTITGLTCTNASKYYVGLVGYADKATIRNVTVQGSSFNGHIYIGAVCGYIKGGTIKNCHAVGTTIGDSNRDDDSQYWGGIVGYITGNTNVINCTNSGTVSGCWYLGGIAGYAGTNTTVQRCFNSGAVTGRYAKFGGIVGQTYNATVQDCGNTGAVSEFTPSSGSQYGGIVGLTEGDSIIQNCYNADKNTAAKIGGNIGNYASNCYYLPDDSGSSGSTVTGITAKTAAQFASGEVAYLLQKAINDAATEGTPAEQVWGQKIGEEDYPKLGGDKVYQSTPCPTDYSNGESKIKDHNIGTDGYCTVCKELCIAYTVTIPATVELGNAASATATISAENVTLPTDKTLQVTVNGPFTATLVGKTDVTAQYTIQKDGTALKSGDPVLTAQNGESPKIPLTFVKPDAAPYAGSYTGTVTFTVSVGDKTPTT